MERFRLRTTAPLIAVLVGMLTAVAVAIAATPEKITGSGVGKIKIGESYSMLHSKGLVGALKGGCPLSGGKVRSARLTAPLKGSVDLTPKPRKVSDIVVEGGAAARGVGIGATIAQIKAKFPGAKVDHSTDHMFGVTLVKVPASAGGKFQFAVSTKTHKTDEIGIPFIPFCE